MQVDRILNCSTGAFLTSRAPLVAEKVAGSGERRLISVVAECHEPGAIRMPPTQTAHDRDVFERLLREARRLDPAVRSGNMFGCPAVFQGRRMAACVYREGIGLRVPAELAAASVRAGRATAFQPYGKSPMREWIQIEGDARSVVASLDLLAAALAFARSH